MFVAIFTKRKIQTWKEVHSAFIRQQLYFESKEKVPLVSTRSSPAVSAYWFLSFLLSLFLMRRNVNMAEKANFFAQKIYNLKLAHVHKNTETLLLFILASFWLMLPFICICNTQCLGYYVHPLSIWSDAKETALYVITESTPCLKLFQ